MSDATILVVDDDPEILAFYQKIFSAGKGREFDILGASDEKRQTELGCLTFSDPKKLLEYYGRAMAAGDRSPLCVVDMRMPIMNGLATALGLREMDPEINIVVCTAFSDVPVDEIRSKLRDGVFFVRKPFVADEFSMLVRSLVGHWNTRQEFTRAQAELAAQCEKLGQILEATRVGTWDWDIASNRLMFDARWAEIVGYDLAELEASEQNAWRRLCHPDDFERSNRMLEEVLSGESEYYDCECRMLHKGGSWIWVHNRGKVTARSADGKPLRMSGTHADITQRMRNMNALNERTALLSSLLESIPDLVFMKDARGAYLNCNAAFQEFVGRSREQVVGLTDYELFPRAVADEFRKNDRIMLEQDTARRNEEWIDYPDGRRVLLETLKAPIHSSAGECMGVIGVSRDITQRKEQEEEIHRARVAADEANKAKSAFLAIMSHEIRTPLNGIIGATELLAATELSEKQAEFVAMTHTSGNSLLSTINDILDYSKIESSQVELESTEFQLDQLVESVIDVVAPAARKRGIDIAYIPDSPAPAQVRGDPTRLRQVLTNLAGNAVKFTEKGWVEINVQGLPDGRLRFSVKDTGIGIPPERIPDLFNPFTQADVSTSRKYGGTGLGLAISKNLVGLMGGELTVKSRVGEGAEFSFDIPLPACPITGDASPSVAGADLAGKRVLVAGQPEINRRLILHALEAAGARVIFADTRETAIGVLGGDAGIDLLLLSQSLCEASSGQQDVSGFSSAAGGRKLPVILLAEDLQKADAALFAGVLLKPLKSGSLLPACSRAISPENDPSSGKRPAPQHVEPLRLNVLLVEDNRFNRIVAENFLSSLGVSRLSLAHDGLEALEILRHSAFDLVFMDCQMPQMDGYQATRSIRELEASGDLAGHRTIVGLSAAAIRGDRERALEAGMDDYLTKPLRKQELSECIARWT